MLFLLTTFALESRCKDTNISRYGKIKFTVYGGWRIFPIWQNKKAAAARKFLPRGGI